MESPELVRKAQESIELKGTLEEFFEFLRLKEYGIMKFQIKEKLPDGRISVDIRQLQPGERDGLVGEFIKNKLGL